MPMDQEEGFIPMIQLYRIALYLGTLPIIMEEVFMLIPIQLYRIALYLETLPIGMEEGFMPLQVMLRL